MKRAQTPRRPTLGSTGFYTQLAADRIYPQAPIGPCQGPQRRFLSSARTSVLLRSIPKGQCWRSSVRPFSGPSSWPLRIPIFVTGSTGCSHSLSPVFLWWREWLWRSDISHPSVWRGAAGVGVGPRACGVGRRQNVLGTHALPSVLIAPCKERNSKQGFGKIHLSQRHSSAF